MSIQTRPEASTLDQAKLGEVLLHLQFITRDHLKDALDFQKTVRLNYVLQAKKGKARSILLEDIPRLGQILLSTRAIDLKKLHEALKLQATIGSENSVNKTFPSKLSVKRNRSKQRVSKSKHQERLRALWSLLNREIF